MQLDIDKKGFYSYPREKVANMAKKSKSLLSRFS